jgi:hypothetical protein
MLQSYHYAEPSGLSVFGSMREELIYPARCAKVRVFDPLDAASVELRLDSSREIDMNLTIDRVDDFAPGRTR